MKDVIAETLGAAENFEVSLPEVIDHSDKDDFESKVIEFRKNAVDNASLDFQDSRHNMKQIIMAGMDMLSDVKEAVVSTQSEKTITAAAIFFKTLGDLNQLLVKMNADIITQHDKSKKMTATRTTGSTPAEAQPVIQSETTNVVMVANTADLFAKAKEMKKAEPV